MKWRISESARIVGMDGVARETERKSCDWISFSQRSGATKYQEELILTVDKEKLLVGQEEEYQFEICTDTEFVPVIVTASKKEDWMFQMERLCRKTECLFWMQCILRKQKGGNFSRRNGRI